MTKSLLKSGLGAVALIAQSACATSIKPTIDTVDRAALERAQTYAFLSEEAFMQSSPMLPGFPVDEAEVEIRDAIQAEMANAGYALVDYSQMPDILAGYMIGVNPVEEQYVDIYRGRFGGIHSIYVTDYDHIEGSLVIDLFEADTGQRIWSGWAEKDFMAPPRGKRGEIISKAVDAILAGVSEPG